MTPAFPLRIASLPVRISRRISKDQLAKHLEQDLHKRRVTSAHWFRITDLYLKLNNGNISPVDIGLVHAELCHIQDCAEQLSIYCEGRLFVYFGVGLGVSELALVDIAVQRQKIWEGVLVDVNPTFLKMFISSLASRASEPWGYAFYYSAIQGLFEQLQPCEIVPENTTFSQKVFVCLGSTIGNFGDGHKIFEIFSSLASSGDRLLVGYQTNKYLPIVFQKYRSHPGYSALIGNFLTHKERLHIEWRLQSETSTVEAWYRDTQLFRSRKFSRGEVSSCAEQHGWIQELLRLDSFENVALQGFVKR